MKLFGKGKKKKRKKHGERTKKRIMPIKKVGKAVMAQHFRSFEDTRKKALKIASGPNLTNLLPRERLAYAKILFGKQMGNKFYQ